MCHKELTSIPNNKLYGFPFTVIPLESNALSYPSLQYFSAILLLLEGFCWGVPQRRCYVSLNGVNVFKMDPLDEPLKFEAKKKVAHDKIRQIGRLFHYGDVRFGQKCSGRCEQVYFQGEAATICLATTLVTYSPYRLANWSSGLVARICYGRCPSHQRTWSTWFWLLILSCFLRHQWRLLWLLVSESYSKIHNSSPVMALRNKWGSVCKR